MVKNTKFKVGNKVQAIKKFFNIDIGKIYTIKEIVGGQEQRYLVLDNPTGSNYIGVPEDCFELFELKVNYFYKLKDGAVFKVVHTLEGDFDCPVLCVMKKGLDTFYASKKGYIDGLGLHPFLYFSISECLGLSSI